MKVGEFIQQAIRVLKLAKKPDKKEFARMVKITGAGMLILGAIGYVFQLIAYLLTLR